MPEAPACGHDNVSWRAGFCAGRSARPNAKAKLERASLKRDGHEKLIGLIAFASVIGTGIATAQNDAIAQRKAVLKRLRRSRQTDRRHAEGRDAVRRRHSPEVADDHRRRRQEAARHVPRFLEDRRYGGPAEDLGREGQGRRPAKLSADATAAAASIKDEASFKAAIGGVLGNCKACHDDYRAKKS